MVLSHPPAARPPGEHSRCSASQTAALKSPCPHVHMSHLFLCTLEYSHLFLCTFEREREREAMYSCCCYVFLSTPIYSYVFVDMWTCGTCGHVGLSQPPSHRATATSQAAHQSWLKPPCPHVQHVHMSHLFLCILEYYAVCIRGHVDMWTCGTCGHVDLSQPPSHRATAAHPPARLPTRAGSNHHVQHVHMSTSILMHS